MLFIYLFFSFQKVKDTRQFWYYLPIQFCNREEIAEPSTSEGACWNGTDIGPYEPATTTTTAPNASPILQEQIFNLQVWTGKLQSAHQGQEVDLADDSEENILGSGSGSGDNIDEEEEVRSNFDTDLEVEVPTEKKPPSTTSPKPPEDTRTSSDASLPSLPRALASYLLPIVLVWFGGTITDLIL